MPRIADKPLAIIGMECRLPGADNLEEFWQLLIEGRSELGPLPPERFNPELSYHPEKGVRTKSYSDKGGIVARRPYNKDLTPLPDELREETHGVHMNLYEVAVSACRRAGMDPQAITGRTGVYIGHTPPSSISDEASGGALLYARQISETANFLNDIPDFVNLAADKKESIIQEIIQSVRKDFTPDNPAFALAGNAFHGSALITRGMNLDGPSMSFDAACASSMRALGHGARALQLGEIDQAIIGSASYCSGETLVLFSSAQSITAKISRPFDNDADGLVAAEGYVVLVMKTLEKAIADGDNILSVIRGIGISSDGKGKSLWVPRHEGQMEAIKRAYTADGLDFGGVQYIEMHATSTQVGDATEMKALTNIFDGQIPAGTKLPIGSVKANVGHTLETAGLASMCKTVLAMQHGMIPPQINISKLNEKIDWDAVPFYVPLAPTAWDAPADGSPRRAAVNAFGIGGLNVHVVMDQFSPTHSPALVAPKSAEPNVGADPAKEPIAIVGMGAIYPGAHTAEALMQSMLAGKNAQTEIPAPEYSQYVDINSEYELQYRNPLRIGSLIRDYEYDWKKHKVPPKQVANADPTQFMLLDAADQAFKNAGYDVKTMDRERIGVIVGSVFGSEFVDKIQMGLRLPEFRVMLYQHLRALGVPDDQIESVAVQYQDLLLKRMPALTDETGSFTASTLASRITKTFDLMGGAVAVDSGESSSFAALASCIDLLRAEDCDIMVCACGQREMSCAANAKRYHQGELANTRISKPFDINNEGSVVGEGVGVLLLKRLSDAERDGDTIHGIIRGIGAAYDVDMKTSISKAITRASEAAGIETNQIAAVEAAASGIGPCDQAEAAAIAESFGTGARQLPVYVGAATSQYGFCGGVSGMTSVFRSLAELNSNSMAPLPSPSEPVDALRQAPGQVELAQTSVPLYSTNQEGRLYAGINSYSYFNLAYHMVMEGVKRAPAPPVAIPGTPDSVAQPTREPVAIGAAVDAESDDAGIPALHAQLQTLPWKIVRIGAPDMDALKAKVAAKAQAADTLFASADDVSFKKSDKARLAVIAENADELKKKLTWAATQVGNRKAFALLAEKGIFSDELGLQRRRVIYTFPGQGSQYMGMLKEVIDNFTPAALAYHKAEEILKKKELPTFAAMAWGEGEANISEVCQAQYSLLVANTIMLSAVAAVGLRADRVCGHSAGELAAFVAAGAWSFEDMVQATIIRCTAVDSIDISKGLLLSTNAPVDVLADYCQKIGGNVWISHRNAPDQNVVGGEVDKVLQLQATAEQAGYKTMALDVPAPFHTPLMEGVKKPYGEGMSKMRVMPPEIPMISTVTNRYVADPLVIHENFVMQLTQPVYYADLIERFADEGPTLFVEVGPRQILTGLHKRTFENTDALYVSTDHSKRPGMQQLLFARACAEASGVLDYRSHAVGLDLEIERERELGADAAKLSQWQNGKSQVEYVPDTPLHPGDIPAGTPSSTADVPAAQSETASNGQHSEQTVCNQMGDLLLLNLKGTSFEIGQQHGKSQANELKSILRRYADLAGTQWDRWPALDKAVQSPERFFGPEELEELAGIAEGTYVAKDAIVAHNLRLYLDAGAGGLHFAVSAGVNPKEGLLHAVNEDLKRGLSVRDCLRRYVMVRHPQNGLSYIAFGVAGQVGCLNGINAAGIAASTSVLLDHDLIIDDTEQRLLPTVLVKRVLENAKTIDEAIQIVQQSHCAVSFSLCLSHHAVDRVCYIEYNGKEYIIAPTLPSVLASNHHLMQGMAQAETPLASQYRFQRMQTLLGGDQPHDVSVPQAQSALRDQFDVKRGNLASSPTASTVRRVDNQVSIVMQPQQGNLWVTAGPMSNGHQNDFIQLKIDQLLKGQIETPASNDTPNATSSGASSSNGQAPTNGHVATPVASESASTQPVSTVVSGQDVVDSYAQAVDSQKVCERFVMRVVECSAATQPAAAIGPFIVLGNNPVAEAIQQQLAQQGQIVYALSTELTAEQLIGQIDQIWAQTATPHLVVATPWDLPETNSLESTLWKQRRDAGALLPYQVCQRWFQQMIAAEAFAHGQLTMVTGMGGDFGFSGQLQSVDSGALAGLAKGIDMEIALARRVTGFRTKIVDFGLADSVDQISQAVIAEMGLNDGEMEVGYINGQRHVARPVVAPITAAPQIAIPQGANFVVTGGARGVTAVVARELGRQFGVKLHLIGSSPLQDIPEAYLSFDEEQLKDVRTAVMKEARENKQHPVETWGRFEKTLEVAKNLKSLADAGISATYHACDISSRESLAAVLDQIRQVDGPIAGVIHGAGFERAASFEKKKFELVDRTIAAKVDGAAHLMELTKDDPLQFFMAFGSVSGRFGGVGQTDYCMSNDMLAKLVDWYQSQRAECRATLFHWHAWDDVGMAVRPESKHIAKMHNIRFMPSLEGTGHLIQEMTSGTTEREIAITELVFCKERFGCEVVGSTATTAASSTTSVSHTPSVDSFPMIDVIKEYQQGERAVLEIVLDPTADIFLEQHRFKGHPLMPVVATLETMVEAAQVVALPHRQVVGLKNIDIQNGLRFLTDENQTARTYAEVMPDGNVQCRFVADLYNRKGNLLLKDKPYLQADVVMSDGPIGLSSPFQPQQPPEWHKVWFYEEDEVIYHGPIFRRITEVGEDVNNGSLLHAHLVAPSVDEVAGRRGGNGWQMASAILDGCFFACGIYLWIKSNGAVAIPGGIGAVYFTRQPRPEEVCDLIVHYRGREETTALFDLYVMGDDGEVILYVDGYKNTIVAEVPLNVE